jgi:purine-binding chemotaxis protein CheW
MPEYIKGITNLRGKIIPVMDLRIRLKKPVKEYDDKTCIVVLDTNSISTGLIVDSVLEVIAIADEDICSPPEVNNSGHKYIKGIGKTNEEIKLLLDCQKILTDDDVELLTPLT